jgi:hypothetical protein
MFKTVRTINWRNGGGKARAEIPVLEEQHMHSLTASGEASALFPQERIAY